jgi:hypothetical protein
MLLDHAPHCAHAAEARAGLDVTIYLFKLGAEYGSGRAKRALVSPSIHLHGYSTLRFHLFPDGFIMQGRESSPCNFSQEHAPFAPYQ